MYVIPRVGRKWVRILEFPAKHVVQMESQGDPTPPFSPQNALFLAEMLIST